VITHRTPSPQTEIFSRIYLRKRANARKNASG
jgi:hypothetical protein